MRILQRSAIAIASAVAVTLALAGAGCGTSSTATRTVTVTQAPTTGDTLAGLPAVSAPPAQPVSTPSSTAPSAFKRCDTNITAKRGTTSCPFAQNVFYAYWRSDRSPAIRAYSPVTGVTYRLQCEDSAGRVVCTAGDGAVVRFAVASVDRYTSANARAYVESHHLGPAPTATAPAPQTAQSDPAPAVAEPPAPVVAETDDFCSTHDCIPNYPNGKGTTVQCADGSYSQSGGRQGACSHHGGVG